MFKGSLTHLQNIVGILKRNQLIVMKLFNALL